MSTKTTGNCFETAAALQREDPSLILVHGLVWHEKSGEHWHAWVERTETVEFPPLKVGSEYLPATITLVTCIDKANGNNAELPAALYYKVGRIKKTYRYTRDEAGAEMIRHDHYGPWVDWEGKP